MYIDNRLILIYKNEIFMKLNLKNLYAYRHNITSISLKYKYIKINKKIDIKEYEECDKIEDIRWVLKIVLQGINYIDYFKLFDITIVITSLYSHYKICSIEFKWTEDYLLINYDEKDSLLLIYLLEQYNSLLPIPGAMIDDKENKMYIDENKTIEYSISKIDQILINKNLKLYFDFIPFSTISCTFNNKDIVEVYQ